jgi:hypothetical protein
MRHDQRQRVLMPGPDEDEVDLHPVDRGRELWQRVQSCLELAPVVLGRPVAGELTHRRQLHALRPILDKLLGRQAGRHDAPAEVGECLFRNVGAVRISTSVMVSWAMVSRIMVISLYPCFASILVTRTLVRSRTLDLLCIGTLEKQTRRGT